MSSQMCVEVLSAFNYILSSIGVRNDFDQRDHVGWVERVSDENSLRMRFAFYDEF